MLIKIVCDNEEYEYRYEIEKTIEEAFKNEEYLKKFNITFDWELGA